MNVAEIVKQCCHGSAFQIIIIAAATGKARAVWIKYFSSIFGLDSLKDGMPRLQFVTVCVELAHQ